MSDDHGYVDLGKDPLQNNSYNDLLSTYYETPHLNRMAREGMTFTQAYVCPNCQPTRAALMTGTYSPTNGVWAVHVHTDVINGVTIPLPGAADVLPQNLDTIADVLGDAGYRCGIFGKWHLGGYGNGSASTPIDHGFDTMIAGSAGLKSFFTNTDGFFNGSGKDGNAVLRKVIVGETSNTNPWSPPDDYATDAITTEAIDWMTTLRDQNVSNETDEPFFLFLSHWATHFPIAATDADLAVFNGKPLSDPRHTNQVFAGMLYGLDRSIGSILDFLENTNDQNGQPLVDNTIVVFLSDNGGNRSHTNQSPLRGDKSTGYEGGIRAPCFVWTPAIRAGDLKGSLNPNPINLVDFFPTFADYAGVDLDNHSHVDGVSIRNLFEDRHARRSDPDVFTHWLQKQNSSFPDQAAISSIHRGRFKLLYRWYEALDSNIPSKIEVYDVVNDLSESTNLVSDPLYGSVAQDLAAGLSTWLTNRKDANGFATTAHLPVVASTETPAPLPSVPGDFAPFAEADARATSGLPLRIPVMDNDFGQGLSLDSVTAPTEGSAQILGSEILYIPPPGYTGTDSFQYTVSNANGSHSATVTVTVRDAGPFRTWLVANFSPLDLSDPAQEPTLWGDLANPDNDDFRNIVEYALGLNPLQKDHGTLPQPELSLPDASNVMLVYRRPAGVQGIEFLLQTSLDMTAWITVDPSDYARTIIDNGDGTEEVRIELSRTPSSDLRQFLRVAVTRT